MKKDVYEITKTDDEIRVILNKIKTHESFDEFCIIVVSRASKCWQSGLNFYPFGEKNFRAWQSTKTILEIFNLKESTGSFDPYYILYIKESFCIYYNTYEREVKLKEILSF